MNENSKRNDLQTRFCQSYKESNRGSTNCGRRGPKRMGANSKRYKDERKRRRDVGIRNSIEGSSIHCLVDPTVTMLDLDDYGTKLTTGIEYVSCDMGLNMDLKRAGWVCPTSGIDWDMDIGTKDHYSG